MHLPHYNYVPAEKWATLPQILSMHLKFTSVSVAQMSASAPAEWVYHCVVSVRSSQWPHKETGVSDMQCRKCDRHLPGQMAGGVKMNRTRRWKYSTHISTSPNNSAPQKTLWLPETCHCGTMCVCRSISVSKWDQCCRKQSCTLYNQNRYLFFLCLLVLLFIYSAISLTLTTQHYPLTMTIFIWPHC